MIQIFAVCQTNSHLVTSLQQMLSFKTPVSFFLSVSSLPDVILVGPSSLLAFECSCLHLWWYSICAMSAALPFPLSSPISLCKSTIIIPMNNWNKCLFRLLKQEYDFKYNISELYIGTWQKTGFVKTSVMNQHLTTSPAPINIYWKPKVLVSPD